MKKFSPKFKKIASLCLSVYFIHVSILVAPAFANSRISSQKILHPINKKLIKTGVLKAPPKFYPNVPRLTAAQAYGLFMSKKAVLVLHSYHDKDKIWGGYWMTEIKNKVDLNKLVRKNQILVFY